MDFSDSERRLLLHCLTAVKNRSDWDLKQTDHNRLDSRTWVCVKFANEKIVTLINKLEGNSDAGPE